MLVWQIFLVLNFFVVVARIGQTDQPSTWCFVRSVYTNSDFRVAPCRAVSRRVAQCRTTKLESILFVCCVADCCCLYKQALNHLGKGHGCQMSYFQTKRPNLGKFGRVLQWKMLVYFMCIQSNLGAASWCILWPLGIFSGYLVHFSCFVMFSQDKSGNPARGGGRLSRGRGTSLRWFWKKWFRLVSAGRIRHFSDASRCRGS
jgi:hypothetical protein